MFPNALSVEAAGKLIDRALAAKGDDSVAAAADVEDEVEEKESIGHIIYKHLMNGVSHMLVFVVAGGVLTAVSFLWGITSFDSTASDYNSFAAMLKIIGGIAMNLMVPRAFRLHRRVHRQAPGARPRFCCRYDRHPGPAR